MQHPEIIAWLPYVYGAFAILILVEAMYVTVVRRRQYAWREAGASLVLAVGQRFTSPITTPFLVGPLFGWLWAARIHTVPLDDPWNIALMFLLVEFTYYWFHRWSHEIRWWWATHAVHHSPQHLNLSAAYRLGWTGLLSGYPVIWMPLVWIGFHPIAVFGILGLNLIYQFWLHTETIPRFTSSVGRAYEYIFNSPSHHRVHHATNAPYIDRNYGGVLILFDRLFGTFAPERDDEPCRYGLAEQIHTNNPLKIVVHEWVRIARDVASARSMGDALRYCFGRPGWRSVGPPKLRRSDGPVPDSSH